MLRSESRSTAVLLFDAFFQGRFMIPSFFSHQRGANMETNLLHYTSKKWTWAMAGLAIFLGTQRGCATFLRWYFQAIPPIIHWREAAGDQQKQEGRKKATGGDGIKQREKETGPCPWLHTKACEGWGVLACVTFCHWNKKHTITTSLTFCLNERFC